MTCHLKGPDAPETPKGGFGVLRLFLAALALLLLGLATFGLLRAGIFCYLYTVLLAKVTEATGLDLWLARALTLALLAAAWFFPWSLLLLPWIRGAKRQVALWAAFLILAVAAMELVTSDVYFSRADGHPLKYYIRTLDGYKLSSSPGTDPVYGVPYRPITSEVARDHMLWKKRGGQMQDPALPEGRYFDPTTGEPLRWYATTPDARIDIFTLPGFHPKYGMKLAPSTSEVVAAYEKQEAAANRQRQETDRELREREAREAERKAKIEAIRRAREEQERQAREEAVLKEPLKPGRYLFNDPRPSGTTDDFRFTLTEVDLTATSMLVHLDADARHGTSIRATINVLLPDGTLLSYKEKRFKEGDLKIYGDYFRFYSGRHGAFVLEFMALPEISAFTIAVNDQPLLPVNLRNAIFRSF